MGAGVEECVRSYSLRNGRVGARGEAECWSFSQRIMFGYEFVTFIDDCFL